VYLEEGFDAFKEQREAVDEITRAKPATGPLIVDVPFQKPEPRPELPRCSRLHTDGRQCESPALVDGECLRHWRWHQLYNSMHGLPLPEDSLSLQEMLAYTVDMVLKRRITPEEGQAVAAIGRIMQKNLVGCELEMKAIRKSR
jgi:hypothetical protein